MSPLTNVKLDHQLGCCGSGVEQLFPNHRIGGLIQQKIKFMCADTAGQ